METHVIDDIVKDHGNSLGGMLSVLSGIQARYGYLPEDAVRRVAQSTGKSLTDIYAVATFYRAFSLAPKGKHVVSVCLGTACHVRGAPKILDEFCSQLQIKPGETTPDKEFTLETVNCLGACALGPTVVVDGRYFSNVTTGRVRQIIELARKGKQQPDADDERVIPLSVQCPNCGESLMDSGNILDGRQSIKLSAAFEGNKFAVYISSLYGTGSVRCEANIANGSLTSLSCPRCGVDLRADVDCPECGIKMAILSVNDQVELHICPRRGCPGHRLDLNGVLKNKTQKGKEA